MHLARERLFLAIVYQRILAALSRFAALQAIRRVDTALAQQCDISWYLKADLAYQAVAATCRATPARAVAQLVARDAHGIGILKCLDRRVHCIAHMYVDTGETIQVFARTHAPAHCLIVGERLLCARVDAACCDIIHRSLTGRWYLLWQSLRKRAKEHIGDTLRGLHV